jgi:hypothetical protein
MRVRTIDKIRNPRERIAFKSFIGLAALRHDLSDRWTNKRRLLSSVQSGTGFYDFIRVTAGLLSEVSASVPNAAIGGIHRIVIRAETNQQVIAFLPDR